VLSEIEEFLPSDSDAFEEEGGSAPPKSVVAQTDNQDNVSRNSLDEDVSD
jgi:hypothetical protein